jgi:hypothetical protein
MNKESMKFKMTLNTSKRVEDIDKVGEDEEETNFEEEVERASTGQPVNRMKQTSRPVPLTVAI